MLYADPNSELVDGRLVSWEYCLSGCCCCFLSSTWKISICHLILRWKGTRCKFLKPTNLQIFAHKRNKKDNIMQFLKLSFFLRCSKELKDNTKISNCLRADTFCRLLGSCCNGSNNISFLEYFNEFYGIGSENR